MTRTASKFALENVHVSDVSRPDGRDYAIGWEIAGDRFHVWVKRGEIEEVIYKNPPLAIKYREPGHYETRRLDRTSKASGAMFAEVLAIVDRDDLVRKARIADRAEIANSSKISELRGERAEIDARVLRAWRTGRFADSQVAQAFLAHANEVDSQLDQLGASTDDGEVA